MGEDLFTNLARSVKMLSREQFVALNEGLYLFGKVPAEPDANRLEFNTQVVDVGPAMARILELKKQGLDPREVMKEELEPGIRMVAKVAKTSSNPWQHISIGRARNNDIVVEHPSISKLHAFIEKRSGGLFITDKDSANGTKVNGRRVQGSVPLRSGDRLDLGSVSFRVLDAAGLYDAISAIPLL